MKIIEVSELIQKCVEENGYHLKKIKKIIKRKINNQLNTLDHIYIENEYFEHCLDCWLKNIDNISDEHIKIDNNTIEFLNKVKHFEEIPAPYNALKYYKLLMEHKHLMTEEEEENMIERFKEKCLKFIAAHSNFVLKETNFMNALLEFLSMFETSEEYPDMSELTRLYDDDISNDEFFQIIMNLDVANYDVKLNQLKYATQPLINQKHIILMREYKEIIKTYLQPVTIEKREIDNRVIIEIKGGNFCLSDKILNKVNSYLSQDFHIEEVRFICSGIMYIDQNLENTIWHGKNIVVYAKAIRVCGTVQWDVSGKSAKCVEPAKAAIGDDNNGIDGNHGNCGESGGNVFIHADNILQPKKLTILSHGGDGSNGQSGGDGKDGQDGTGISYADFMNKFPSCVHLLAHKHAENRNQILRNMKSLGTVIVAWKRISGNSTINEIINTRYRCTLYAEAMTEEGHKLYYSSYIGGSFFLYKGSLGKPGGYGGAAGLGGHAGFSGEVICNDPNVIIHANLGKNGNDGEEGKHGKYGKNGWDMGWLGWIHVLWPKVIYYGTDQNRKVKLEYYNCSDSTRAYVYYRKYLKFDYQYAQLSTYEIPKPTNVTYTEREKISSQPRHQAERKKNISQNYIFKRYSQYLSKINTNLYQNLQTQMKDTEKYAYEKMMENRMQQTKEVSQITISRMKPFPQDTKICNASTSRNNLTEPQEIRKKPIEVFLENIQKNSLNDWFELKNVELEYSHFDKVFHLFQLLENKYTKSIKNIYKKYIYKKYTKENQQQIDDNIRLKNIKLLLMKKYNLAIFQQIATKMNEEKYQPVVDNSQLTPENALKYLMEIKNPQVDLGIHEELEKLQNYFFEDNDEQRKKLSKFCTTENMTKYIDAFKYSIKTFVIEEGEKEETYPNIKKYYQEYNNFIGEQETKIREFYKESKLEVGSCDKMLIQWLEDDLKEDKYLETKMYKQFTEKFNVRFNWDNCCKDQQVFNKYVQHIRNHGPLSPSYRELLAHIYNVNICVYIVDQSNKIQLLDIHNSRCTDIIYILYTNEKFTQLDIKQDYLLLDMLRENKANLYMKISVEIDSLQKKADYDEYMEKLLFLFENKYHNASSISASANEKQDICDMILRFFSCEEKQELKCLLEKISSKYIKQNGILQIIAKCFSCNGRHVTYDELYCLINTILNFFIEDMPGLNIFCWIIATYPQRQWINEIILLKLENHFQMLLPDIDKWRKYLINIQQRDILLLLNAKLEQSKSSKGFSMQCIEKILYLLTNISESVPGLQQLELSEWPYVIKEKYWVTRLSMLTDWKNEELQRASYYLLSLENSAGTFLVNKFIDLISSAQSSLAVRESSDNLLQNKKSKKNSINTDDLIQILSSFHNEEWNFSDDMLNKLANCQVHKWLSMMKQELPINSLDRDICKLIELIRGNGNTSKCIIDNNLASMEAIIKHRIAIFSENGIKSRVAEYRSDMNNFSPSEKIKYIQQNAAEILDLIDITIKLKRNFRLRDTQKLAILALLKNKNTLMQVSTGEGKSLIVVALSIFKALCGQKVDIITSSSVLAKRDANINSDIYELFSISAAHNCDSDVEKRKEIYSCKNVIYGELAGFQRDYLLDRFYGKNILGDRNFENVVIDEVDSMLLDKGNNMLYLSHDLPCLDKLESIYVYIWQLINRPCTEDEEFLKMLNDRTIKQAVLRDLHGWLSKETIGKFDNRINDAQVDTIWERLITHNIINSSGYLIQKDVNESDIRNILSTELEMYHSHLFHLLKKIDDQISKETIGKLNNRISDEQVNVIWERLIKRDIIDSNGYLLRENVNESDIKDVLSPDLMMYHRHLSYLWKEIENRQRFIYIPNYLRPFIALHLDAWINSAKTALFMQERRDYIVDVDRKEIRPDLNANITIIDRDTGTDQTNSQWDEALHQFLQLKHGCKLSMQSLKAVFISNVRYLKFYTNLYGLTGTLGSQRERDLLQKIYKTNFVTIPTTKPRKFHECDPIVCSDQDEWNDKIYKEATDIVAKNRSILIICETVRDVDSLYRIFKAKKVTNVHTYTRDYESFDIARDVRLQGGQIIIATNLAGRGTDIKITDKLDQAGGLHVCLTYLPNNNRVEQQAFGRAARCGNNGSGKLIILSWYNVFASSISETIRMKKDRYFEEISRISDIKLHYETRINEEENALLQFQDEYIRLKDLMKNVDEKQKEMTETLLCSCLDEWAFWLDENNKYINCPPIEQKKQKYAASLNKLIARLQTLKTRNFEEWEEWIREPTQIVKIAKYFAQNKNQDLAIKLFDRVIDGEPCFSEAAHYYKALSLIKKMNSKDDSFLLQQLKYELRQASFLFEKHRNHALMAGSIIDILKRRNPGILQIDAFKEQHKNISTLYQIFVKSINDIFGHYVTPQSFENCNYNINEELSETLYEDLIKTDILKKPKISLITWQRVKKISKQYGIIPDELNAFLNSYDRHNVDLNQFEESFKKSVNIANKEDFWKLLVKGEILIKEVKYLKIDVNKLQNIDPSLLEVLTQRIQEKTLEKQTLKCEKQELLLYPIIAAEENDEDIILKKSAFKQLVGLKEKYKILKRRRVLSINKKATFDPSKVNSFFFPCYDSITLQDFAKRDIPVEEARSILADLVEQEILIPKGEKDGFYQLATSYDKIAQFQLSSHRIYEPFVISLLNICFLYKIALQKLADDFKEEIPINLQIISKPHQSITYSLIEERIIKLAKVSDVEDLKNKLGSMYTRVMEKSAFMRMLHQNDIIPQTEIDDMLFNYIVEEKLIDVCYYLYTNEQYKIRVLLNKNTLNDVLSPRRSTYMRPTKTIKLIIDTRNHLGRKDTIKNVATTLEVLKNTFKSLETPDCTLVHLINNIEKNKSFSDYPEEELHVFTLNGLNHLLELQEKPWSWKTIGSIIGIIILGVFQIVVGCLIHHLLPNLAGSLICEGIGDVFFAMTGLISGRLTWEDYRKHKIISLAFTGVTFGLGAWLQSYALKAIGPISSMYKVATKLLPRTNNLAKLFIKRVTSNVVKNISLCLSDMIITSNVENHLQKLCNDIALTILSETDRSVDQYDISDTLTWAYQNLGQKDATAMIQEITKNYFAKQDNPEFSQFCSKITNAVRKVIMQSKAIRSPSMNNLQVKTLLEKTSTVTVQKVIVLKDLSNLTNKMLHTLNLEIQTKLQQLPAERTSSDSTYDNETDMNNFKQKMKEMWKSTLRERANQTIDQEIVRPILHDVLPMVVTYIANSRQTFFTDKNHKEKNYFEQFNKHKEEHKEDMQRLQNAPDEIRNRAREEYCKNLIRLLMKTRNHHLFADIIAENVPMDTTCLAAYLSIVQRILDKHGIKVHGLTINLENDTSLTERLSTVPEGCESMVINLRLTNSHFLKDGDNTMSNDNAFKNDCLYETLCQRIPKLRDTLTASEFREEIAREIKNNPSIRDYLSKGKHQTIAAGIIGRNLNYMWSIE